MEVAATGDSYQVGRTLYQMLAPMLLAHDVTPNAGYYAEVKAWMAALKPNVIDRNTAEQPSDGYREIIWLNEPDLVGFYATDNNKLDEITSHNTIALWTLWADRVGDTAERDYWLDYLENDYTPKWAARSSNPSPPTDNLAHSRSASVLTCWCLYLLTANMDYLVLTNEYWDAFVFFNVLRDVTIGAETGVLWNHSNNAPNDIPQATNYARYTVTSLYLLHYLECPNVDQTLIDKVTVTIRENVMNNGAVSFADFIDGTGVSMNGQMVHSDFWLYAKHDDTDEIVDIATVLKDSMSGSFHIQACMVAAGL